MFRYIGDTGTYLAFYDDLATGRDEPVDLSDVEVPHNGVDGQHREFVAAIGEGREPEASINRVLPSYRVLAELDQHSLPASAAGQASGVRREGWPRAAKVNSLPTVPRGR